GRKVRPADLELASLHVKYQGLNLKEAREALETDLIQGSLARNNGNITKAAAELGVSRPTLYELMEKLGIERK
ncbi:MAG: AAA family ATPase, partial [candidate division Zixibacteria bacterium]|nr:AAA family ATPase [candidate division Zixibacteria bacterium]